VILTNKVRYPQGFQTPGIVRLFQQGQPHGIYEPAEGP
jgi:hypothetical protein